MNDDTTAIDSDVDTRAVKAEAGRLQREFGLRRNVALAVAYKREGFSHFGVSKLIDISASTIKGYFKDIDEEYGPEALFPYHGPNDHDPFADDGDNGGFQQ